MLLTPEAIESIRSTLAARGVTSLTDDDPTEAEYLWAALQDLDEVRAELERVRPAHVDTGPHIFDAACKDDPAVHADRRR